jgi:hypothetical protein
MEDKKLEYTKECADELDVHIWLVDWALKKGITTYSEFNAWYHRETVND